MERGDSCETDEFEEIIIWLDQLPLSRLKKNLTKDFSDGVLMAEVLKIYYPKLVELHNYIKTSSTTVKIDNWTLLNRKVLKKLTLKLSTKMINELATSVHGSIQRLLTAVRQKITDSEGVPREPDYFGPADDERNGSCTEIVLVPVKSADDGSVLRHQQMVTLTAYHKKKRQLAKREDEIACLTERISHLESMVNLKDQRIKDLNTQLLRYQHEYNPAYNNIRR